MRDNIGLYRGKRKDNGEWVWGYFVSHQDECYIFEQKEVDKAIDIGGWINGCIMREVKSETIGRYTGLTDKNGKRIFEGDIVQYLNDDDFDCCSTVKFGEYKQDGSGGEYGATKCLGFYAEVGNFTRLDWFDDDDDEDDEWFPHFQWQQNILEVADKCEVIGNIHDNPDLLEHT